MKQISIIFMAVLSFSQALLAQNYDFSAAAPSGQTLYYKITDTANHCVSVTYPSSSMNWNGYNAPTGSLTIPSVVVYMNVTYTVNAIGNYAFNECSGITSVTLPNTIVRIGDFSFRACNISHITIPNSVGMIERGAFVGNTIQTISGCDSVYYIGEVAFGYQIDNQFNYAGWCSGLPSGIVYIGRVAYGYKGTIPPNTHITFNSNTIGIAAKAFYQENNIVSVSFPISLQAIGDMAFAECNNISSIDIPHNVKLMGGGAFYNCNGLTSVEYNARRMEYIRGCGGAHTGSATDYFYLCHNLSSFIFGDSVRFIPSCLLEGLPSAPVPITSINIPCNVDSIGLWPFQHCTIDTIYYNAINCRITSQGLFGSNNQYDSTVTKIIFGEGVESIPEGLCKRMSSLQGQLILPNSVRRIGKSAFNGCSSLSGTLSLPSNLEYIGNSSFNDCSGLTGNITIPDNVAYIGWNAFSNCSNISSLSVGRNVDTMQSAFMNMPNLTSVQYNAIDCHNGSFAFQGNQQISLFLFGDNVRVIPDMMVFNLPNITSLNLPDGLTRIGQFNFSYSNFSDSIILPYSLQEIGYGAFSECGNPSQIVCNATNPPTIILANGLPNIFIGHTDVPLLVPCESVAAYRNAQGWNTFTNISGIGDCDTNANNINDVKPCDDIYIYSRDGHIVINGATEEVRIFDMTGRAVPNEALPIGVYMVKVGNRPARKVVVIRQ